MAAKIYKGLQNMLLKYEVVEIFQKTQRDFKANELKLLFPILTNTLSQRSLNLFSGSKIDLCAPGA